MDSSGFFAGLFDWDFKQFVALRFIKLIYIVGMVFIILGALAIIFSGFAQGGGVGFGSLILALVGGLVYLIFFRVTLEVIAVLFRIGDNTSDMVNLLGGNTTPPAGGTPPSV